MLKFFSARDDENESLLGAITEGKSGVHGSGVGMLPRSLFLLACLLALLSIHCLPARYEGMMILRVCVCHSKLLIRHFRPPRIVRIIMYVCCAHAPCADRCAHTRTRLPGKHRLGASVLLDLM